MEWVGPLLARSAYTGSAFWEDLKKVDLDSLTGDIRCDGSFKRILRPEMCDGLIDLLKDNVKVRIKNIVASTV